MSSSDKSIDLTSPEAVVSSPIAPVKYVSPGDYEIPSETVVDPTIEIVAPDLSAEIKIDPGTTAFISPVDMDSFTEIIGSGFGIPGPAPTPTPVFTPIITTVDPGSILPPLGGSGPTPLPTVTPGGSGLTIIGLGPTLSTDMYFAESPDLFIGPTEFFDGAEYNAHKVSGKAQYIDTNLIKNSNDNFRNLLGGNYSLHQRPNPLGEGIDFKYIFNEMTATAKRTTAKRKEIKLTVSGNPIEVVSFHRDTTKVNNRALDTLNIDVLLVSDNRTLIETDENWRRFIVGGRYNNTDYRGITVNSGGEEMVFECYKPFELQNIKTIVHDMKDVGHGVDYYELTAHTNYELRDYERYVSDNFNSLSIPNYYSMMYRTNTEFFPPRPNHVKEYYSLNGVFRGVDISDPVVTPYPPPEEFHRLDVETIDAYLGDTNYTDRTVITKKYLNTFTKTSFTPEIKQKIIRNNANILFPHGIEAGLNNYKTRVPYYNSIKIPNRNEFFVAKESKGADKNLKNIFNNLINNEASTIFCNMLKKHFVEQDTIQGLETKNYVVNSHEASQFDESTKKIGFTESVSNTNIKYIDLYESLVDEYEQEISDLGLSLLPSTLPSNEPKYYYDCLAVNSNDKDYRMHKSIPTLKLLNNLVSLANTSMWKEKISPFPLDGSTEINEYFVKDFLDNAGKNRYSETIGHRIEKIEINNLDSNNRSTPIQNILIMKNDPKPEAQYLRDNYEYIDTQIKKGSTYSYNIYEYKIVMGYRYKIIDPITTRSLDKAYTLPEGTAYCLEFYDPSTLEAADSRFSTIPALIDEEAPFFTDAQIISPHKYLAQVRLQIEPVYRIYEIPMLSKTVTNTDHPPHPLEVSPYQRKDDSQIIGFHLLKENFSTHDFPAGLSEEEDIDIQKYLNSQNLVDGEQIQSEAKSKTRYIEVYRIDKKPNSLRDFNNALVATKDLILDTKKQDISVCSDCFYEEKIKTNTKLYYTFRIVTSGNIKGSFTPIFEAELIDDGNYKYANFNRIELNNLNPKKVYNQPSKKIKKLLQMIPAPGQTLINTDGIDFSAPSEEQLENIQVGNTTDSIWDKKFKLRLTSKKTGKKIDLNVTYKLRR